MYIQLRAFALLVLVGVFAQPAISRADEVYTFVVKKQEEKSKAHWNISDWLETRDKMRLMDLWLALHSPAPYEFYLDGSFVSGKREPGSSYTGAGLSAGAFASIFGLGIERLPDGSGAAPLYGLFLLRVFGYHDQSTNITLQAGVRSDADTGRSAVLGVHSNIYLAKHFGIDGLYQHAFESVASSTGSNEHGSRYEAGAFIEFKFLRVYGEYFGESETVTFAGASGDVKKSGIRLGTRLYF